MFKSLPFRGAVVSALLFLTSNISYVSALTIADVWINEFHYDNSGGDSGEFVEIAGIVGTDISGLSLFLYNGNNQESYASYSTAPSASLTNIDPSSGLGFYSIATAGIQNGAADAIALVFAGTAIQFLSYEGNLDGKGGPAHGQTSADVGVTEGSSTPVGSSLQLVGSGYKYSDFKWEATKSATPGTTNTGQVFLKQSSEVPNSGSAVSFFILGLSGLLLIRTTCSRKQALEAS